MRVSRTVLREAKGETPLAYSPSLFFRSVCCELVTLLSTKSVSYGNQRHTDVCFMSFSGHELAKNPTPDEVLAS